MCLYVILCIVFPCYAFHILKKLLPFPLWEFFEDMSGYSHVLQETLIPIIPEEKCRSPEIYGTEITENMFCAGYFDSKSDACQVT